VLGSVAAELGVEASAIEDRLFADLRGNERLVELRAPSAEALLDRYDVALAQGVLLRATRVTIELQGESAVRSRQLFRAARFHGLLHRVRGRAETGYAIELDGPLSLFSAVRRYGFKMALFLPAVLRCRAWRLEADLLWGKGSEPRLFRLGPEQGLVPHGSLPSGLPPDLSAFCADFDKLGSAWTAAPAERIFALAGEAVCIPDLVFTNAQSGEQVYLEAFGFWSRAAVWQRVETLARGFPARIILAVGKQLRVSEEVLDEQAPGQIYVYRTTMSPRAVLRRLEANVTASDEHR